MPADWPETCAAAVMRAFAEPLTIEQLPMPQSLGEGELLVKVELAGVCGTDVHLHRGELPVPLPLVMGHETTGVVVATGGPRRDWLGEHIADADRVCWTAAMTCATCTMCRVHSSPNRCLHRRAFGVNLPCDEPPYLNGGYAEYHVLRANTSVFRLPDAISSEAVVGPGCALVTAIHGFEAMPVRWMETVVVQGAGPVGLAAAALAADCGAGRVIVIGGPKDRLDRCRRFGATDVIDIERVPDPDARREIVRDMTDGIGADLVVECAGVASATGEGWELARDCGRFLELGQYCDCGPQPLNPHLMVRKEMQMGGVYGSEPRHWARALQFLQARSDQFPFEELITDRLPLDRINDALELVGSWKTGKVVITP